eukprot:CAMPEP_0173388896 /NCGR_PEP_ID=MMETSP1356-20130122/11098_1 /TAXON_ID=77927 ORGANISM="Hemiselmis virescens, Strain PCC157" /NCGR_SAMPLE_ID=MMETSP1356 /ASSEMBLY_ACC=CAM_ASM_000847 /LENGTH=204 /DNA_ID=CAMNT_0014345907 /DNA_START=1 /DNA_END=612 /DNA_ORIENTATION=-
MEKVWEGALPVHGHRLLQLCLVMCGRYAEWADGWLAYLAKSPNEKDRESEGYAQRSEEELRTASSIAADCKHLSSKVNKDLADAVTKSLASNGIPPPGDALTSAISPASAALTTRVPKATSHIVTIVAQRCSEPLAAVRAITSQYRMTNKPAPSKPSLYVAGVVSPLKAAAGPAGCLRLVDEGMRRVCLDEVAGRVCGRMVELV